MSYLPEEIKKILTEKFFFPQQLLFGAVATVKHQGSNIRMMRIYDFDQNGSPVLLTHVLSSKWREFTDHSLISICIVSENKQTQIVVRGALQLDTPLTSLEKANRYWPLIRSDVKKIYDPAHLVGEVCDEVNNSNLIASEKPLGNLGIACMIPSFWEVLSLESEYTQSNRFQFHLNEGKWQKKRVNVG